MDAGGIPSSIQEGALNSVFNSLLTEVFLMGIYTVVYFETLYIYLTRKASQRWIIVGVITLLYVVYLVETSVEWVTDQKAFISDGTTQASAFVAAIALPGWGNLIFDICSLFQAALADGLLIWRCYNVWDGSFRAIAVSCFLLLSETVVYLAIIIIAAAEHLNPPPHQAQTLDRLTAAALFMTFGTSVLTTLLIAYRIHSVTKQDILPGSKARFKYVLEILVQSAAAYSVVTIASAIAFVFPLQLSNLVSQLRAQNFTSIFYAFVAGIVPTIMVARVASAGTSHADTEVSVMTRVSGLRFGGQSSAHDVEQMREDNGVLDTSQDSESLKARKEGRLGA